MSFRYFSVGLLREEAAKLQETGALKKKKKKKKSFLVEALTRDNRPFFSLYSEALCFSPDWK